MNSLRPALVALAMPFIGAVSTAHAQAVPKGDIVVDVENFSALPTSGDGQPARANVLLAAPDGRIFVNDQRGPLYTVSGDGATVTLYLDLAQTTPLLSDNGERGFQSFAFHPDFRVPGAKGYGKFYTMASQSDTGAVPTFVPGVPGEGRDHDEVLLEWIAADPAAAVFAPADPAHPFREVLRIARPNGNHNAGFIAFNPTAPAGSAERGYLYIGTGDSGGGGDPLDLAQSPGKAYGAILRINPLAKKGTPYRVPTANPYVTNPALLPEKYLAGFRNPQRFTWDPADGRMFISDIGQNHVEEIDIATPGANYGWSRREGDFVYNRDGSIGPNARADAASTGFTYPAAEYMHFGSAGNGVSAGPVVRGDAVPALKGRLIFSDFPSGTPYTIDADAASSAGALATVTELRLRQGGVELSFLDLIHQVNPGAGRADLRWGTDANGRIYLLDKQDGLIRRIALAGAPTVSVSANVASISCAAGEKATVTLSRGGGDLSAPLSVSYELGGTAVNGEDYKSLPLTKTIPAGAASTALRIKPLADGATSKIRLSLQPGAGYQIDPAAHKAKIRIVE